MEAGGQNQFVNSSDLQTNNCSSNSSKRHGESTALAPYAKRQGTEIVSQRLDYFRQQQLANLDDVVSTSSCLVIIWNNKLEL